MFGVGFDGYVLRWISNVILIGFKLILNLCCCYKRNVNFFIGFVYNVFLLFVDDIVWCDYFEMIRILI